MATVASITVGLSANSTQFEKGMKKARDEAKKTGGALDDLKKKLGEQSEIGNIFKLLRGAGAVAGLAMAANAIKHTTGEAVRLRDELNAGKISSGQMAEELARSIPILGAAWEAGRNIRDLMTNEELVARQIAAHHEHMLETTKLRFTFVEKIKKSQEDQLKTLRDVVTQTRLIGASPAEAARINLGVKQGDIARQGAASRAEVAAAAANVRASLLQDLANAHKIQVTRAEVPGGRADAKTFLAATKGGAAAKTNRIREVEQQIATHDRRTAEALAKSQALEHQTTLAAFVGFLKGRADDMMKEKKAAEKTGGGRANLNAFGEFFRDITSDTGKGLSDLFTLPAFKQKQIDVPNARPLEASERRSSFFTPESRSDPAAIAKQQLAEQKKNNQTGRDMKRLLERGLEAATNLVKF